MVEHINIYGSQSLTIPRTSVSSAANTPAWKANTILRYKSEQNLSSRLGSEQSCS